MQPRSTPNADSIQFPPEVLERILLSDTANESNMHLTCWSFYSQKKEADKEAQKEKEARWMKEVMAVLIPTATQTETGYPAFDYEYTLNIIPQLFTTLSSNSHYQTRESQLNYLAFLNAIIHHLIFNLAQKSNIQYLIVDRYDDELVNHLFLHITTTPVLEAITIGKLSTINREYSHSINRLNNTAELDPLQSDNIYGSLTMSIKKLHDSKCHNTAKSSWLSYLWKISKEEHAANQCKAKINHIIDLLAHEFKTYNDRLTVKHPFPF